MFFKRNLRNGGSADITRRAAITGVAAGLAGAMLEAPLRGQKQEYTLGDLLSDLGDSTKLVVSLPVTQLWNADMYGNKGSYLGTVLACPQSCAALRPGYAEARTKPDLKAVYLNTSEWMREIIFTPSDLSNDPRTWRNYRKMLGSYRISNDASATGCGHISRNVMVTQVSLQSGAPAESLLGVNYSSVVVDKVKGSSGPLYQAKDIYIYQGNWAPLDKVKTPVLNAAVAEIGTDDRPNDASSCPTSDLTMFAK